MLCHAVLFCSVCPLSASFRMEKSAEEDRIAGAQEISGDSLSGGEDLAKSAEPELLLATATFFAGLERGRTLRLGLLRAALQSRSVPRRSPGGGVRSQGAGQTWPSAGSPLRLWALRARPRRAGPGPGGRDGGGARECPEPLRLQPGQRVRAEAAGGTRTRGCAAAGRQARERREVRGVGYGSAGECRLHLVSE